MFLVGIALMMAAPSRVLGPPVETGSCRWIHGRFNLWNGSSVRRIWIIGTHRIVALRDEDSDVPEVVDAYLNERAYLKKADGLFGDFEVCALEPNVPGHMQHIRLTAAKNLVFRGRPFNSRSVGRR